MHLHTWNWNKYYFWFFYRFTLSNGNAWKIIQTTRNRATHVLWHYNIEIREGHKNINKNKKETYLRINFIFTALTYAVCEMFIPFAFMVSPFLLSLSLTQATRRLIWYGCFLIANSMRGYYLLKFDFNWSLLADSISIFTNGTWIKSIRGGCHFFLLKLMMIKPQQKRCPIDERRKWANNTNS